MREGFMNVPGYQHNFEDGSGLAALPIASFVVFGDKVTLLDAGYGPHESRNLTGGALLDELAAIGVRPADVDVVAISHLHLDHDGWLATIEAEAIFAGATIFMGRGDYELFVRDDAASEPRFKMAPHLREVLTALHDEAHAAEHLLPAARAPHVVEHDHVATLPQGPASRPMRGSECPTRRASGAPAAARDRQRLSPPRPRCPGTAGRYSCSPGSRASMSARSFGRAAARLLRRNISRPMNPTT